MVVQAVKLLIVVLLTKKVIGSIKYLKENEFNQELANVLNILPLHTNRAVWFTNNIDRQNDDLMVQIKNQVFSRLDIVTVISNSSWFFKENVEVIIILASTNDKVCM